MGVSIDNLIYGIKVPGGKCGYQMAEPVWQVNNGSSSSIAEKVSRCSNTVGIAHQSAISCEDAIEEFIWVWIGKDTDHANNLLRWTTRTLFLTPKTSLDQNVVLSIHLP
jgi:hypothetical protein